MKNNILKVLVFTAFVALVVFNFKSNTKFRIGDTNLIQQAHANVTICIENTPEVLVCCNDNKAGNCRVGGGEYFNNGMWDGPYYRFDD